MLNSEEEFVLESICGLKNIQNVLDDFISRPIEWKLQSVFEILKENEVMYILEKNGIILKVSYSEEGYEKELKNAMKYNIDLTSDRAIIVEKENEVAIIDGKKLIAYKNIKKVSINK